MDTWKKKKSGNLNKPTLSKDKGLGRNMFVVFIDKYNSGFQKN